jgi:hypothetical protein
MGVSCNSVLSPVAGSRENGKRNWSYLKGRECTGQLSGCQCLWQGSYTEWSQINETYTGQNNLQLSMLMGKSLPSNGHVILDFIPVPKFIILLLVA